MSRIIAAIDGSDRGLDAAVLGARLAAATGSELVLAHAYRPNPGDLGGWSPETRALLRRAAIVRAMRTRDELGVRARIEVHAAAAHAPLLCKLARRDRAAVIVVGSCDRGAVGRVFAGSTADELIAAAPCAVAVAPRGLHAEAPVELGGRLGCARDAGPGAHAALEAAIALAHCCDAGLDLIDASTDPDEMAGSWPELADAGPTARAGLMAEAIVARSADLDLLVCGAERPGPLRRNPLGPVSQRLVSDAACPVLIAPEGSRPGLRTLLGRQAVAA